MADVWPQRNFLHLQVQDLQADVTKVQGAVGTCFSKLSDSATGNAFALEFLTAVLAPSRRSGAARSPAGATAPRRRRTSR